MWKGCTYVSTGRGTIATERICAQDVVGKIHRPRPDDVDIGNEDTTDTSTTILMANDSFFIQFEPFPRKILILCFDEDVVMAGARPTGLWDEPAEMGDEGFKDGLENGDAADKARYQRIRSCMPFSTRPIVEPREKRTSELPRSQVENSYADEYEEDFGDEF